MSLKFGEPKSINVGGMKIISVKTVDSKPVFVKTGKCFSHGVKKDIKYKTMSMSLNLDENSAKAAQDIVEQCEQHLGTPLTKQVFYSDNTVTLNLK